MNWEWRSLLTIGWFKKTIRVVCVSACGVHSCMPMDGWMDGCIFKTETRKRRTNTSQHRKPKWVQPSPHLSSLKLAQLPFHIIFFMRRKKQNHTVLAVTVRHCIKICSHSYSGYEVSTSSNSWFILLCLIKHHTAISNGTTRYSPSNANFQEKAFFFSHLFGICVSFEMRQMTITAITAITTASNNKTYKFS